jgi:hypothetical protein
VNTSGMRKAALAMATMHPDDRQWMLDRMPMECRPALTCLIDDARRFTMMDEALLQAALDGVALGDVVEVPAPAVLIAVLDTLSSHTAACVLAAAASDHVDIYLAACEGQRSAAIRHELSRLPRPFPGALGAALARQLQHCSQTLGLVRSPA